MRTYSRFVEAVFEKRLEMLVSTVLVGICWLIFGTASIPVDDPPGIVTRINPTVLDLASDFVAKHFLERYIGNNTRDMIAAESCIFDNCSLEFEGVNNYVPPKSNVTFRPGIGVEWKLEEAGFSLRFSFEFKTTDGNESSFVMGYAGVQLSGISLTAEYAPGKSIIDGRLLITLSNCSVDIPVLNSNVFVTHKVGFVSRKINVYLQDIVNKSISTGICDFARVVAQAMPNGLSKMNKELASSFGFTWNDTLADELSLENNCIETSFGGEFGMVGEVGASIPRSNFYLPPTDSSMIAVYMSESTINTLCDVLYKTEMFSVNITKDLLVWGNVNYGNLFDTTCDDAFCFGAISPNISEKYPNTSTTFVIRATSRPSVTIRGGFPTLQGEFYLRIIIPEVNGSEVSVANLSMSVSMLARLLIFRDRLMGAAYYPKITVTDNGSPKEFVSYLPRFNFILQAIFDWILVPKINYYGAIGYPLPVAYGMRLANADISFDIGALRLTTDIVDDRKPLDDRKLKLLLEPPPE